MYLLHREDNLRLTKECAAIGIRGLRPSDPYKTTAKRGWASSNTVYSLQYMDRQIMARLAMYYPGGPI
jgi:hypothetical protein